MNVRDFTFDHYGRLLDAALDSGYTFYTVDEYVRGDEHESPHIVVRHDVDRKIGTARSMARVEAERGVPTTYYFRTSTFRPDLVAERRDLGHEVGYHYEDLVKTRGDFEAAHERFSRNLTSFREHADISTICPHGSPLSPHHNLDMWRGDRMIEDYDLLGEAYLSVETASDDPGKPSYVSDTGRDWGTAVSDFGRISTTDDLTAAIESDACERLYLLVHPGRWSRHPAEQAQRVAWDLAAEFGKTAARTAHSIGRASGNRVTRAMRERV
ncbi:MAG: hypothetical protein QXG03_13675 [Halalkalicoccus sp.]